MSFTVIKAMWRANFEISWSKGNKRNVKFHVNTPFLTYYKQNSNILNQNICI